MGVACGTVRKPVSKSFLVWLRLVWQSRGHHRHGHHRHAPTARKCGSRPNEGAVRLPSRTIRAASASAWPPQYGWRGASSPPRPPRLRPAPGLAQLDPVAVDGSGVGRGPHPEGDIEPQPSRPRSVRPPGLHARRSRRCPTIPLCPSACSRLAERVNHVALPPARAIGFPVCAAATAVAGLHRRRFR